MEISTVTQRLTVVSLTDDEVERYIDHPELLALELIKSGNHTGHIGKIEVVAPSRKPATATRKPAKKNSVKGTVSKTALPRKSGGEFECKHCHRGFKRAGNRDNHESSCTSDLEIGKHQPGD